MTAEEERVSQPPERRQLMMRRPNLDGLPRLVVPSGYALRSYRRGDEAAWAAIMNTGIGSDWTAERCVEYLTGQPQFRADGLFFTTVGDTAGPAIGSACAWTEHPDERDEGLVHMVCVLPEHRGHGLGRVVTLAVLRYMRQHGFRSARLRTDDWRRSAIRAYLSLGLEPLYPPDAAPGDDHRARWAAVIEQLGASPAPGTDGA